MVTEVLINYLNDDNVDIKKKQIYLERLNLSYSDLFELREIFGCNTKVYQIIHGLIYYRDKAFENKINYQDNKRNKIMKQKKKRRNNYGKYKRR